MVIASLMWAMSKLKFDRTLEEVLQVWRVEILETHSGTKW
jgi:hypothetical protein